ncbi:glycoside hydrolase family 1 protein [Mesoplasma florum]|uniref:glycoside hydrolase family 1 protein n=1 Tax=Mesoplasma florum TaxID=2151 RepID=UPI000D09781F|nr:family 1 glycosylhydrolase [Mesoplasma florum]AVN61299.1 aryl-phospho-beta-d-glucosidase [Mesoplasma florum]
MKKIKNREFIFSCSTNAFQIEGGRNLGGRTDSIWDEFTKRNFKIPPVGSAEREINSIEIAADFFHKYKTDANIMKNLGLNGFIYNMDWTRIFPKNSTYINPEGLKWHIDMFETMVNNGIKPIPIIFHWDTPMWAEIQGGWENPSILDWFRNYCKVIFKYLGRYTDMWFVNDENSTFTLSAYLSDYMPPAKNNPTAFAKAIHHLNLSAAIAKQEFDIAKKEGYLDKDALLGIDHDWSPAIPLDPKDVNDLKAVEDYNEWFLDFWLDPNLKGTYPEFFYKWIEENNIDFKIKESDMDLLKNNTLDFVGWNYYRPCFVSSFDKDLSNIKLKKKTETFFVKKFKVLFPENGVRYTDWNWIIDPSMLEPGAKIISKKYDNKPMMIVENGLGDFDNKSEDMIIDEKRIEFLKEHIEAVLKAKENGVNFIGYSMWTYCDIFSPSGGYRKDYGLVSVDFNSPIRERKPKLSYVWYKKVIASNGKDLSINIDELKKQLEEELIQWDLFKK